MNTDDLRVLAERAAGVEGRQAGRLDEVHDRIRTARRRRAAASAVGAVAVVLAVVLGTTLVSDHKGRSQDPVKPTPSPSETFEVPAGQTTVKADVHPGDVVGWKVLATVTNSQPEHRGDTELGTTVMVRNETTFLVDYCNSTDPSVWFFTSFTDGGGGYGRCDEGTSELPPPDLPLMGFDHAAQPTTVRMFVTRLSPEVRACYLKGVDDCEALYGEPQPMATTDAEFGFRMYDHWGAPDVLRLFGYTYEALSTVNGKPWIVDRAVISARGADRLAFRLPDAKHRWLVGLFDQPTAHEEACARRHGLDDYPEGDRIRAERARARVCGARLRPLVDGSFRPHGGEYNSMYGEPWTYVAPGGHEVTVDVTKGDPRNVRYAVIVWRAGP